MKRSRGTVIPGDVKVAVEARDRYCVCDRAGFPDKIVSQCMGWPNDHDHVRASHGMGMKSESTVGNIVLLSPVAHRWKTENGRVARPLLLAYLASVEDPHSRHVDPCGPACRAAVGSEKWGSRSP